MNLYVTLCLIYITQRFKMSCFTFCYTVYQWCSLKRVDFARLGLKTSLCPVFLFVWHSGSDQFCKKKERNLKMLDTIVCNIERYKLSQNTKFVSLLNTCTKRRLIILTTTIFTNRACFIQYQYTCALVSSSFTNWRNVIHFAAYYGFYRSN